MTSKKNGVEEEFAQYERKSLGFYKEITKKIGVALHINEIIDNKYFNILWGNEIYKYFVGKEIEKRNEDTALYHKKHYSENGAVDLADTLKTIVDSNHTYSVLYKFRAKLGKYQWILSLGTPFSKWKNDEKELIVCASTSLSADDVLFKQFETLQKDITRLKSQLAISVLSKKEQEVIILLGKGLSEKGIAQKLSKSTHTVKTHLKNIRKKLNINKNTELVKFAIEKGFV